MLCHCFLQERLPADREQPIEGTTQTAGKPEHFSEQPDSSTAATHHHPAGAEFIFTYTDC